MGCTASNPGSLVKVKSQDNYAVETNGNDTSVKKDKPAKQILTNNEKILIRNTWEELTKRDKELLGKNIFLNIFKKHPTVQAYFKFRDVKMDGLFENKDFTGHAFRFIQILDSHVTNMDDLANGVLPVLRNLGRFHARHGEWFSVLNFNLFTESILFTWEEELGDQFTIEKRDAWASLLDYLVQGMTEGYHMARV